MEVSHHLLWRRFGALHRPILVFQIPRPMGPADHAAKYTYFGLEHLPWAKWASSPLSHILQSGGYPSIGSTGPPNAIDHLEHWSSLEKDADKQKRYIDAASILIAAVTPPCNWKTYLSAVATSPNLARHNLAPSAAPPARAYPGQKKRARPIYTR